ncbi:MAG: hypothetical protein BZ137_04615 [Methanosphaera sp. rholeuAM130]|nr:hypothetical protein [Methanosphaera sp.]RAP53992.1 MAG: hypothetical protein BZ137_04615 [Methanosphaera sp. rholeuAM130]
MTNILANSKIYKNYQTVIPKEVRKQYNVTDDTIIEWTKTDSGELNIKFRKKVTLEDVAGMIKKEDDTVGDWDIDRGVYLNE